MDQEVSIYVSKLISIQHYYGSHDNTLDGNHSSGSHPNEEIKVFNNHQVGDHLYTLLLSMGQIEAPLNLLNAWWSDSRGFQGSLYWALVKPTDICLSDRFTSDIGVIFYFFI